MPRSQNYSNVTGKITQSADYAHGARSSSTDSPYGAPGIFYQSSNQDSFNLAEQSLITANDVLNLPKGQAFCLLEGGKLYKLRMPLPQVEHQRFFWVHPRNQWLLDLIGPSSTEIEKE